jgi:hypothetical protein
MPRAPKAIKKPAHRPQLLIDWKQVDEYLIAGCPGTKIADALGIHHETLYNRCEQEKGMAFSSYSQQKRTIGDAILQKAQFDKAIGNTEKGDNTLLIWLGKVRLEQRETSVIAVDPETNKNFESLMKEVVELQRNGYTPASEKTSEE